VKPEPTETAPATIGTTVEYRVKFARGPKGRKRVKAEGETAPVAKVSPTPVALPRTAAPVAPPPRAVSVPTSEAPPSAPAPRVPKIALLLTLAWHFERLVRDGVVKDYAAIATRAGLTRARVSQIAGLTLLAPDIQEEILSENPLPVCPILERELRQLASEPSWSLGRVLVAQILSKRPKAGPGA
jgi:hypothetical protein